MALVAPVAPMARSTNRSTPHHGDHRMPTTERYRCRHPAPTGTRVRRRTGSGSPPGSSAVPQAADPRPGRCRCELGTPAALGGNARRPPRTTEIPAIASTPGMVIKCATAGSRAPRLPAPSGSHTGGRKSAASNCARICALTCAFSELTGPVPGRAGGLEGRVRRGPEPLGMIALEALIGGPPEISGPVEPLVRPIRIPLRRKLISEAAWNFASCLAHSR
jgi:hypothetical protein